MVSKLLLDLAGANSRKKPPLQAWQAYSALYYRPKDSPLRAEVRALFEQRHNPDAVAYLADFLPPETDIGAIDFLIFLGAFAQERCMYLSTDEEEVVRAYIEADQLLALERQDYPWRDDNDYEDNPLLAENRYIQR